jgi:spore coat polysaccharide biosynthesis protein SpsF
MILGIIQVRMGSTRLPGKVLKDINGMPMLLRLYERCKMANLVDKFVISTADNEENRIIREFADKHGIEYYAGSENDLLDRIYQTGKKFGARAIVRITGDCPLIEPKEIDRIVKFHLDTNEEHDYVSNNFKPTLPDGLDTEIIKFSTIEQVWKDVQEPFWRELALSYIFENPDKYKIKNLEYERSFALALDRGYAEILNS